MAETRTMRSWVRIVVFAAGVLATGGAALGDGAAFAEDAERTSAHPFFRRPMLLGAHRGGMYWRPENTAVAYRDAAAQWPEIVLEGDARLTADGAVVLLHDETVDRTTDGVGAVAEMTLAEVRRLDAGHRFTPDGGASYPYRGQGIRVPTLREALDAAPGHRFLIEIKGGPDMAEAVLEAIVEAQAEDRVLLGAFDEATMDRVRRLAPTLPRCFSMVTAMEMLTAYRAGNWEAYAPKDDVLTLGPGHLKQFGITPSLIAVIREKGVRVQLYDINTPREMRSALAMGVDGILTGFPERLAAMIDEAEEKVARGE